MERTIGLKHHSTLCAITDLAAALAIQYNLKEAIEWGQIAFKRSMEAVGILKGNTINIGIILANILMISGRDEEVEALLRTLLKAQEETLGRTHTDTLFTLSMLGVVLIKSRKEGSLDEARNILREAVSWFIRWHGWSNLRTLAAADSLSKVFLLQGDQLAEAEFLSTVSYAERVALEGPGNPTTIECGNQLVEIHRQQGRADKADELQWLLANAPPPRGSPGHTKPSLFYRTEGMTHLKVDLLARAAKSAEITTERAEKIKANAEQTDKSVEKVESKIEEIEGSTKQLQADTESQKPVEQSRLCMRRKDI